MVCQRKLKCCECITQRWYGAMDHLQDTLKLYYHSYLLISIQLDTRQVYHRMEQGPGEGSRF